MLLYCFKFCLSIIGGYSARWIGNHGFSIGIDDVQPGAILSAKKEERIREGYNKCDMHIDLFNRGKLALQPGCDLVQTLEAEVMGELNKIREVAGKVTSCLLQDEDKLSVLFEIVCSLYLGMFYA